MCSHEPPENNTLGTSTLDLQNTTITVIWAQADFSELYLVIQKGTLKYAMTYVRLSVDHAGDIIFCFILPQ